MQSGAEYSMIDMVKWLSNTLRPENGALDGFYNLLESGGNHIMSVKLNAKYLANFVGDDELNGIRHQVEASAEMLHNKTGLGSDYLGWLTLPTDYDKEEFARIQAAAKKIQGNSEVLIVIGIGGSYLGARAAIEFLKSPFYNNLKKDTPDIYYVGNNINPTYLNEVISICES